METKGYKSPKVDVVELDESEIITTSDIEAGVETVPLPETGGTWEVL